ncbi:glycosyltransferase family 4 protein [Aequorivita sp. F47161]|uniref:Glycosyltransferase family 4 protein n=1 Tax=Aequorivita vitellina TaxID=2874475 RepID=A0A9X1R064_9FLAO|nr:glycosyltransferase [Aequorivita vitellina]MCG2419774.1 glycosyltransferase family 4 protein [Aequorivita vitellina]
MKTLAYVYDARCYKYQDDIFGVFDVTVWDRFLDGFDEIIVFASIYKSDIDTIKKLNLNKLNHPKVEYVHVPFIDTPKRLIKNFFINNSVFKKEFCRVDAVVIRVPGQYCNNAFHVAKKMNLKVGLEVVGCPFDAFWNYGNMQGKILALVYFYWMKHIVKHSDYVLYVTKHFLQKRYPTKSKHTINASNVDVQVSNKEKVINHRLSTLENNIRNKKITLGLIGSFGVRYKGHEEILKAVSTLDERKYIYIEMIGGGDYKWVEKLAKSLNIENNVKILGKLKSGDQVLNWLNKIDIYIHPSKQEGLPRSVIEAMSQACPVLASKIAGIPELLDNNYLHKTGDFKHLSLQISRIIFNSVELEKMINANFKTALAYDRSILSTKRKKFWLDFSENL